MEDIDVELEFHFAETVEALVAEGWTESDGLLSMCCPTKARLSTAPVPDIVRDS